MLYMCNQKPSKKDEQEVDGDDDGDDDDYSAPGTVNRGMDSWGRGTSSDPQHQIRRRDKFGYYYGNNLHGP
jgi:hypothetical protein